MARDLIHTGRVLISRRTLLVAAAASTIAGCRTRTNLEGSGLAGTPGKPSDPNNANGSGDPNGSGGSGSPGDVLHPRPPSVRSSVLMIGDSITVGAQQALKPVFTDLGFQSVSINAQKSRRIDVGRGKYEPIAGTTVARFVVGARHAPGMWIVALGTNDAGQYRKGEYRGVLEKMLSIVPTNAPLVWIDIYRSDYLPACQIFNAELRDALATRPNSAVGEWYQTCNKPDARVLGLDGVHPNKRGVFAFIDTVRAAAASLLPASVNS